MVDITSAPAAIAAWKEMRVRLEPLTDQFTAFVDDVVVLADSMGDFAIGCEDDTVDVAAIIRDEAVSAKEGMDAYIARLEAEYGSSIEAASGKQASAHRPMQEV